MKTERLRPCARCKEQSPKDRVDGYYLCLACREHKADWLVARAYHARVAART